MRLVAHDSNRLRGAATGCTIAALTVVALQGCTSSTEPPKAKVAAVAAVEVRTLEVSEPDPAFHATCQTGAAVVLDARGSNDPAGRTITYEWLDTVEGQPSADFLPRMNPFRTTEPTIPSNFFTIGFHELTLTVTASDGRKSSTTLRIKVMPCDCGG